MSQGILGLSGDERQSVGMHPEAFIGYKLGYECKHCGKKWTKLQVEKKPLPREYAYVEEEEAREDEYSREE